MRYLLDPHLDGGHAFDFQFGSDGSPIELQERTLTGAIIGAAQIGLPDSGAVAVPNPLDVTAVAFDGGHLYYALAPDQYELTSCDAPGEPPPNTPSLCPIYDSGRIQLQAPATGRPITRGQS